MRAALHIPKDNSIPLTTIFLCFLSPFLSPPTPISPFLTSYHLIVSEHLYLSGEVQKGRLSSLTSGCSKAQTPEPQSGITPQVQIPAPPVLTSFVTYERNFTSLGISFLIHKMGILTVLTSLFLVYGKYSINRAVIIIIIFNKLLKVMGLEEGKNEAQDTNVNHNHILSYVF